MNTLVGRQGRFLALIGLTICVSVLWAQGELLDDRENLHDLPDILPGTSVKRYWFRESENRNDASDGQQKGRSLGGGSYGGAPRRVLNRERTLGLLSELLGVPREKLRMKTRQFPTNILDQIINCVQTLLRLLLAQADINQDSLKSEKEHQTSWSASSGGKSKISRSDNIERRMLQRELSQDSNLAGFVNERTGGEPDEPIYQRT